MKQETRGCTIVMTLSSINELKLKAKLSKANYSVRLEWSVEKWYEIAELTKLKPEDKEKACENIGCSVSGPYGTDGYTYDCFTTLCKAVKKSPCNPFELTYCGDFTEEEITELHTAIIEMYEAGDLSCYDIPDVESRIKNFVSDFRKACYQ